LCEPTGAATHARGVITAATAAVVARPPPAIPGAIGGDGGLPESDDSGGLCLKSGERSSPALGVRAVTHCGRMRDTTAPEKKMLPTPPLSPAEWPVGPASISLPTQSLKQ
jgi:hypothetical protein